MLLTEQRISETIVFEQMTTSEVQNIACMSRLLNVVYDGEDKAIGAGLGHIVSFSRYGPVGKLGVTFATMLYLGQLEKVDFNALVLATRSHNELIELLRGHSEVFRAFERLHEIRGLEGWDVACDRASCIDSLLTFVFDFIIKHVASDCDVELLYRGSLAHGILSVHSDLDIEVSGPAFPLGHRPIERALIGFARLIGFDCEGSDGRPTEQDLVGRNGQTRDLHEWCELRKAGSPQRNPGWLIELFSKISPAWWRRQSVYEGAGRHVSAKYAFFESRALLSRLSLANAVGFAVVPRQLESLRLRVDPRNCDIIEDLVRSSLVLYDAQVSDLSEVRAIQARLDELRSANGLPGPSAAVLKNDVRLHRRGKQC